MPDRMGITWDDDAPQGTPATGYDTPLSPQEERLYQAWKAKYAPKDSGADYDLRGAYKAGLSPDPQTGHWSDRYKKPNHPTFSDQSLYAKYGVPGRWEGEKFIPPPRITWDDEQPAQKTPKPAGSTEITVRPPTLDEGGTGEDYARQVVGAYLGGTPVRPRADALQPGGPGYGPAVLNAPPLRTLREGLQEAESSPAYLPGALSERETWQGMGADAAATAKLAGVKALRTASGVGLGATKVAFAPQVLAEKALPEKFRFFHNLEADARDAYNELEKAAASGAEHPQAAQIASSLAVTIPDLLLTQGIGEFAEASKVGTLLRKWGMPALARAWEGSQEARGAAAFTKGMTIQPLLEGATMRPDDESALQTAGKAVTRAGLGYAAGKAFEAMEPLSRAARMPLATGLMTAQSAAEPLMVEGEAPTPEGVAQAALTGLGMEATGALHAQLGTPPATIPKTGDRIVQTTDGFVPRAEMPQIKAKYVPEFLTGLQDQGVRVTRTAALARDIKPMQKELNLTKVQAMAEKGVSAYSKPMIMSSDGFILDGHHRWAGALANDPNAQIPVYKVDLPIEKLLDAARSFPKTTYQAPTEAGRTQDVGAAQDSGSLNAPKGSLPGEYRGDLHIIAPTSTPPGIQDFDSLSQTSPLALPSASVSNLEGTPSTRPAMDTSTGLALEGSKNRLMLGTSTPNVALGESPVKTFSAEEAQVGHLPGHFWANIEHAKDAQPEITGLLQNLASEVPGAVVQGGRADLKTPESAAGKIKYRTERRDIYGEQGSTAPGHLKDWVRGRITFSSLAGLRELDRRMKASGMVVGEPEYSSLFDQPKGGFRSVYYLVKASNGHVGEVQFTPDEVQAVSDGPGHVLYESTRRKHWETMTPQEWAGMKASDARMQQLFDEAWGRFLEKQNTAPLMTDAQRAMLLSNRQLPPGAVPGRFTRLLLGNNHEPVQAQYALVDFGALKIDTGLGQNRNTNSVTAKIGPRGEKFYPEAAVSTVPWAQDGPATALPDGTVVGGNTRAKMVAHLEASNAKKFAEYKDHLKARAADFGVDPGAVDAMKRPVLVRVVEARGSKQDSQRLVTAINTPTTTKMSTAEQAAADAALLPENFLDSFAMGEGESFRSAIRKAANAPAMQTMTRELFPEMASATDVKQHLSRGHLDRMEAAVLAKALGAGRDSDALEAMLMDPDPGVQTLKNALLRTSGALVKARSYMDSRAVEGDPIGDLAAAVEKYASLKSAERDPAEFASQQQGSMFGDEATKEGMTDKQLSIIKDLSELSRSGKKTGDYIESIARGILKAPHKGQGGLFRRTVDLRDTQPGDIFTIHGRDGQPLLDVKIDPSPDPTRRYVKATIIKQHTAKPNDAEAMTYFLDRLEGNRLTLVGADEAYLSRAGGRPGQPSLFRTGGQGEGLPADQISRAIRPHEANLGLRARIVDSLADVPEHLRKDADGAVTGVYDKGTGAIYLIRSAIKNAKEAVATLYHEGVTHKGLRVLFKEEADLHRVLDGIFKSRQKDVELFVNRMGYKDADLGSQAGRRKAAEEFVASFSENPEALNVAWYRRLVAYVKDQLRKVAPGIKWSDNDIRALLAKSKRGLQAERDARLGPVAEGAYMGGPFTTREVAFRRGEDAPPEGGYGLSDVKPEDVFWHGSASSEPFQAFDPAFAKTGSGEAWQGEGTYLGNYRGTAERYNSGGQVIKADLPEGGKFLDDTHWLTPEQTAWFEQKLGLQEGSLSRLSQTDSYGTAPPASELPQAVADAAGIPLSEAKQRLDALGVRGYLSEQDKQVPEFKPGMPYTNHYVVWNPERIRIVDRFFGKAPYGESGGLYRRGAPGTPAPEGPDDPAINAGLSQRDAGMSLSSIADFLKRERIILPDELKSQDIGKFAKTLMTPQDVADHHQEAKLFYDANTAGDELKSEITYDLAQKIKPYNALSSADRAKVDAALIAAEGKGQITDAAGWQDYGLSGPLAEAAQAARDSLQWVKEDILRYFRSESEESLLGGGYSKEETGALLDAIEKLPDRTDRQAIAEAVGQTVKAPDNGDWPDPKMFPKEDAARDFAARKDGRFVHQAGDKWAVSEVQGNALRFAKRYAEALEAWDRTVSNYVPHKRYGEFVVRVDQKGQEVWSGRVENRFQLRKLERALREKYGDGAAIRTTREGKPSYESTQGIAPLHFAAFLEGTGLDADTKAGVEAEFYDALRARGFGQAMIHRQGRSGIAGFESDLRRPIADYLAGYAGWRGKGLKLQLYGRAFGAINPKGSGEAPAKPRLLDWARAYTDQTVANTSEYQLLKAVMYHWYLGWNFKSALVNGTQQLSTGWNTLGTVTDKPLAKLAGATKDLASGNVTEREQAALLEAERSGHLGADFAGEISGAKRNPVYAGVTGPWNNFLKSSSFLFSGMEGVNRKAFFLAAFRALGDVKAAADLTDRAHFKYGVGNRPEVAGSWRQPFFIFRSWAYNYFTMLKNHAGDAVLGGEGEHSRAAGAAAVARMTAAALVLGGVTGTGAGQAIRWAYRKVFGKDPEDELRAKAGKTASRLVFRGAPAALGLDISGSLDPNFPADPQQASSLLLGPVQKAQNVGKDIGAGQYYRAVEDMAPEVLRNPMAAARLYRGGQTARGGVAPTMVLGEGGEPEQLRLSAGEALLKAAGIQPTRLNEISQQGNTVKALNEQRSAAVKHFAAAYIYAYGKQDEATMQKVLDALDTYNAKMEREGRNVEIITADMIRTAIRDRMMPAGMSGIKKQIQYQEGLTGGAQ